MIYALIGVLLGVGILFGGVSKWSDPADCGGVAMYQGDTCEVTDQNGNTSDNDLSQQEKSNHVEGVLMMVTGPLMAVGSVFWLRSEIRTYRRRSAFLRANAVAGAGPRPGPGRVPQPAPVRQPYVVRQQAGAAQVQQQVGVAQAQQQAQQQTQQAQQSGQGD